MAEETVKIPQHRHCIRCGKAFIGEDRYCTEKCKETKKEELKASKRKLLIFWAVSVCVMIGAAAYLLLK